MHVSVVNEPGTDHIPSSRHANTGAREPGVFFRTTGKEVEDLLYPLTPREFVDRYWTREPLYIAGSPTKFAELFSLPEFHSAAKRAGVLHVEFKDRQRLRKPDPEDIDVYLQRGATVCLTDIGHTSERLQALVDAVKGQLNFSGLLDIRAYLSSDGCGYGTHADARVATTLQISGKKRWRFSRQAAVEFPLHSIVPTADGYRQYRDGPSRHWEQFQQPDEASFLEVVLEPGDLLCLPAGVWHAAQAIGHSLAINMAFNCVSFDSFVMSALRQKLISLPEWRAPIPLVPGGPANGAVPDEVAFFFSARLGELKTYIEALAAKGPELAHAWREGVCSRSRMAAEVALAVPTDSKPIGRGDRFIRSPFTSFGWSLDEALQPALAVYEGTRNRSITLLPQAQSFMRKLMTVQVFQAEECLCWAEDGSRYDWPAVEAILRTLLEGGVLQRDSQPI